MSENKNSQFRFIILAFLLLLIGFSLFIYGFSGIYHDSQKPAEIFPTISQQQQISGIQGDEAFVSRVIDGDTVELATGEKVRYIGIDTPETVDPRRAIGCFGKEASLENKKLVEGKTVILAKDISENDQFNRLLRLVYLKKEDGSLIFVNDYLIRQGFAKVSTFPPDVKNASQFLEAEKEARENQKGLWKMCI